MVIVRQEGKFTGFGRPVHKADNIVNTSPPNRWFCDAFCRSGPRGRQRLKEAEDKN
jgi:hypothetical protein